MCEGRQAEEAEQQWQREARSRDEPFTSSLNGRQKAGLQDIAFSLDLNIEGRVEDLKTRINTYFEEHQELRTDPCYIGLFPQPARQTHQATTTSAPLAIHHDNINLQPEVSDNPDINNKNQYIHFSSLAHTTPQHNHAQRHTPGYPNIPLNSPYHPGHLNQPALQLASPGYVAHSVPPYYYVNSGPSNQPQYPP